MREEAGRKERSEEGRYVDCKREEFFGDIL